MNHLPTVSVIIAAFNAQATLPACLTSLQQVTYPRAQMQVVVVDNASTDNSRAIAESFGVRAVSETKRGASAARNRGLASTTGEVVAFTDADCVVDPHWIAELIHPLQDETIGIVGGAIHATRPCNAIELFGEHIHNHQQAIEFFRPPYAMSGNWASPRAVLEGVGGFDEKLRRGEDVDLAWRILRQGGRLVYRASAVVRHRNESSLRGLFREGVQHGYYSIPLHRKHKCFLQQFGYRRANFWDYRRLLSSARQYGRTRSIHALCDLTFHCGKTLGKVMASARYGYPDF